jgi:hypothetical protein
MARLRLVGYQCQLWAIASAIRQWLGYAERSRWPSNQPLAEAIAE